MNFDFPFSESIFIYFGLSIIVLSLVIIMIFIVQAYHRFAAKKDQKEKRSKPKKQWKKLEPGCITMLVKTLFISVLIGLGFLVIVFGVFVQSLTSFTKQEVVAEVSCQKVDSDNHSMTITLLEKKSSNANIPQQFLLIGDQWFIRGDIVRWESWLNLFGLKTMYKLTRIGGYFTNAQQEKESGTTQYSLVPEEESPEWRWLYKNGYKLPFISDVYGNSVYQYPDLNKVFRIYVTANGFAIGTEEE